MHITAILLEAYKRGKVSPERVLEILTEHLPHTCEACSEGKADFDPALGRARPGCFAEARDPVARLARRFAWGERQTREEVRLARRQVREIVRLDPRARLRKIRGANSRYLGPLFGALLLEEARRRIPAEPEEALALAEAALVSSSRRTRRHEPDPEVQVAALAVGGNARRALGCLREGEADLEKALELLHDPRLRDPALPAEVYSYLGSLRKDQGKLEEAERHLQLAGLLYDVLGEPKRAARVLLKLGIVHNRKHAFEDAVAAVEQALERIPEDGDLILRASARYNLAHFFYGLGHLERAEEELSLHKTLLDAGGDWVSLRVPWLQAKIAWSRRDLKAAVRLYTEARRGMLKLGLPFEVSLICLELALAHLTEGRTGRVKTLAAEALKLLADQEEVEREIRASLALVEEAARREALTRELLERAIAALERRQPGPGTDGPGPA